MKKKEKKKGISIIDSCTCTVSTIVDNRRFSFRLLVFFSSNELVTAILRVSFGDCNRFVSTSMDFHNDIVVGHSDASVLQCCAL